MIPRLLQAFWRFRFILENPVETVPAESVNAIQTARIAKVAAKMKNAKAA